MNNTEHFVLNSNAKSVVMYFNTTNVNKTADTYYDVFIENTGRANYQISFQNSRRGLDTEILLDGHAYHNYTIISYDFNRTFVDHVNRLTWPTKASVQHGPTLYRTTLKVKEPADTFLSLPGWHKGNVFVNSFNIGRYNRVGPQKTLYIPAPLLKKGDNSIIVFELHKPGTKLEFLDHPIL